jgi:hypothetical protein
MVSVKKIFMWISHRPPTDQDGCTAELRLT